MNVKYACHALALATLWLVGGWAVVGPIPALAQSDKAQITVLYDAFGKTSTMTKDWGFAASSSTAASASCSTPATTPRSLRTM